MRFSALAGLLVACKWCLQGTGPWLNSESPVALLAPQV